MVVLGYGTATEDRISGSFLSCYLPWERKESHVLTQTNYERMIGYLESATERYGARIHCFCLMSNHYQLLLETPRGNLRQILHHLNTSYSNYFNTKTGKAGHLFQGRYRAILVDKVQLCVGVVPIHPSESGEGS